MSSGSDVGPVDRLGRLARTIAKLHPVQIAARPPHALLHRAIRDVPSGLAPHAVRGWPDATEALRYGARLERDRGARRLAHLPATSRLRAYEACYGLELGDGTGPHADWSARAAVEAYPASVRARRIAVATRLGRQDLERELARAARATLLGLEVHLLGNHLLENGFGLACAGAASTGPEANLWWTVGRTLLDQQLSAQFLADGGHIERSATYHLALTYALLETIELARAAGRRAPDAWREIASRALGWARAICTPDGAYPLFNDASLDAGPAIGGVLALGAAIGITPARVGARSESEGVAITRLDSTGWLRMDASGACVVVDVGPDAEGWQPGHCHADGLTFELWVDAARVVVDYGVASYETDAARSETRATRSHNTLELDGRDSCEVWGGFRVGRRGRATLIYADATGGTASASAEHDGYGWLPDGAISTRTIALRRGRLEIRDGVRGGKRRFVSRLRLDGEAASAIKVTGSPGLPVEKAGQWFAEHGRARPAVVYELAGHAGENAGVAWTVEW